MYVCEVIVFLSIFESGHDSRSLAVGSCYASGFHHLGTTETIATLGPMALGHHSCTHQRRSRAHMRLPKIEMDKMAPWRADEGPGVLVNLTAWLRLAGNGFER